MFSHSSVYDLCDVFDGLRIVLHAVVGQGDVVGQRWHKKHMNKEKQEIYGHYERTSADRGPFFVWSFKLLLKRKRTQTSV